MSSPRGARPGGLDPNPTDNAPLEDPAARTFTIGQVLTVACGDLDVHQLFCPYGEFIDVIRYLLSDVPLIDDMPATVAERARPAVLAQHPQLADVEPPEPLAPDTEVLSWLLEQEREYGARLVLTPIEEARGV